MSSVNDDQPLVVMETITSVLKEVLMILKVIEIVTDYLPDFELQYFNGEDSILSIKFATEEQLLEMIKRKQFCRQVIMNQACKIGSIITVVQLCSSPISINFKESVMNVGESKNADLILDFLYEIMLANANTIQQVENIFELTCIRSVSILNWFRSKGLAQYRPLELFDHALEHGNSNLMDITYFELGIYGPLGHGSFFNSMYTCLKNENAKGYCWLLKNHPSLQEDYKKVEELFVKHGQFLFSQKLSRFQQIYQHFYESIKQAFQNDFIGYLTFCSPEIYFWLYEQTKMDIDIESILIESFTYKNHSSFQLSLIKYALQKYPNFFTHFSIDILVKVVFTRIILCEREHRESDRNVCDIILKKNMNSQQLKELLQQHIPIKQLMYNITLGGLLWYFEHGGLIPLNQYETILKSISDWSGYDNPIFKTFIGTETWELHMDPIELNITHTIDIRAFLNILRIFKECKNVRLHFHLASKIGNMNNEELTELFELIKDSSWVIMNSNTTTFRYFLLSHDHLSDDNVKNIFDYVNVRNCFQDCVYHEDQKILAKLLIHRGKDINIIEFINSNYFSFGIVKIIVEHFYHELKDYGPWLNEYRCLFDFMARKQVIKSQDTNGDTNGDNKKQPREDERDEDQEKKTKRFKHTD